MTNNWKISRELEEKIRNRDKICVYCHKEFKSNSKDKSTWEHIDNNEFNICEENVVLCCNSCNASKGKKTLKDWLESNYCRQKNINKYTVADIIKKYLKSIK